MSWPPSRVTRHAPMNLHAGALSGMKTHRLVAALVLAGIALAPSVVLAGGEGFGHSGRGGGHGQGGSVGPGVSRANDSGDHRGGRHDDGRSDGHGQRHDGRGGHHGFKGHDGFKNRQGFASFPIVTLYIPPLYYGYGGYGYGAYGYGAPLYGPPPVYYPPAYAAPQVYAAATLPLAPPPPMARVVEYPNGRFELHGDGTTAGHTWVWIPNPPPVPPVPGPPAPPSETRRVQPATSEGPSAPRSPLYRWTDEQGVIHLTNRPPGAGPDIQSFPPKRAPTL